MTKQKQKITEEESRKKFHDFMFNEEGYISIKEALERAKKRWPRKQKVDKKLTNQFKNGLEDLKSGRIKRVA
jgi:hypothetical protein